MILVYAEDDFQKNLKIQKIKTKHNTKFAISKMSSIWCFFFKSARQVCKHLSLNSIKTALNAYFLKKIDFYILIPKIGN